MANNMQLSHLMSKGSGPHGSNHELHDEESKDTGIEDEDESSHSEDEQEDINFDQLLGDAAQSQADYEEDREDLIEDQDDEGEDSDDLELSLNYTKTLNESQKVQND